MEPKIKFIRQERMRWDGIFHLDKDGKYTNTDSINLYSNNIKIEIDGNWQTLYLPNGETLSNSVYFEELDKEGRGGYTHFDPIFDGFGEFLETAGVTELIRLIPVK